MCLLRVLLFDPLSFVTLRCLCSGSCFEILNILRSKKTVFSFKDILLSSGEEKPSLLNRRLYHYTKNGMLYQIRRGMFVSFEKGTTISQQKGPNKYSYCIILCHQAEHNTPTLGTHSAPIKINNICKCLFNIRK